MSNSMDKSSQPDYISREEQSRRHSSLESTSSSNSSDDEPDFIPYSGSKKMVRTTTIASKLLNEIMNCHFLKEQSRNSCKLTRTFYLIAFYLAEHGIDHIKCKELEELIFTIYPDLNQNKTTNFKKSLLTPVLHKKSGLQSSRQFTTIVSSRQINESLSICSIKDNEILTEITDKTELSFEPGQIKTFLLSYNHGEWSGFPYHYFNIKMDKNNNLKIYSSWLSGEFEIQFDSIPIDVRTRGASKNMIMFLLDKMLDPKNLHSMNPDVLSSSSMSNKKMNIEMESFLQNKKESLRYITNIYELPELPEQIKTLINSFIRYNKGKKTNSLSSVPFNHASKRRTNRSVRTYGPYKGGSKRTKRKIKGKQQNKRTSRKNKYI